MPDQVQKFLAKVSAKERAFLADVIKKILSGDMEALQVKKLAGYKDFYRIRKGKFRIIYKQGVSDCTIILIDRRYESTYRDFS